MARKPKATAPAPTTTAEQVTQPAPATAAETSLAEVTALMDPAATASADNPGSTDDEGQAGAGETGKDPAAAPAPEPKTEPQGVLIVTGPKRGRWRAGRHFGPEAVNIPLADLTPDELDAIVNDEKLKIAVVYPDAET